MKKSTKPQDNEDGIIIVHWIYNSSQFPKELASTILIPQKEHLNKLPINHAHDQVHHATTFHLHCNRDSLELVKTWTQSSSWHHLENSNLKKVLLKLHCKNVVIDDLTVHRYVSSQSVKLSFYHLTFSMNKRQSFMNT